MKKQKVDMYTRKNKDISIEGEEIKDETSDCKYFSQKCNFFSSGNNINMEYLDTSSATVRFISHFK